MKVLVLAHGDGRRWNDPSGRPFLDCPKQLVQFHGETLLARTVRQFRAVDAAVTIVAPDDRFDIDGADRVALAAVNACGSDMGKLIDTRHLWDPDGRTVIVWGDCFYTDELVEDIATHAGTSYHVWRRPGRSEVTGARWDESFAISFHPADHARMAAAAEHVAALVVSGELKASHIRTHLAAMSGYTAPNDLDSLEITAACPSQTNLDDWSDDFDSPSEWRTWMRRRFDHDGHRVGVCIPWLDTGETWRTASYRWGLEWWAAISGVEVFIGADVTGGEHPNRSAMRNDSARQAVAAGCDVLFFADSDTFVPADEFWTAVNLAVHHQRLVLAFDRYIRVTKPATLRMMRRGLVVNDKSRRHIIRRSYRSGSHISGAIAIPTQLWNDIGGYDERFARWGYEDRALWLAARTIGGDEIRVHGDAYHWWHPGALDRDRQAPDSVEAARLARRYYIAAAWVPDSGAVQQAIEMGLVEPIRPDSAPTPDVAAMRALLAEPCGPLARTLQEV